MDNWAYPRARERRGERRGVRRGGGGGGVAKDNANSIHKRGLPLITHAVALSGE